MQHLKSKLLYTVSEQANKYIPLSRAILPMNDNTSGYTSAKKSAKEIEIRWNPGWTAVAVTRGARGQGAPQAPSSQHILGKSSGTKAKYIFSPAFQQNLSLTVHFLL